MQFSYKDSQIRIKCFAVNVIILVGRLCFDKIHLMDLLDTQTSITNLTFHGMLSISSYVVFEVPDMLFCAQVQFPLIRMTH